MPIPDPDRDTQFYEGVILRRFFAFWVDLLVIAMIVAVAAALGLLFTAVTLGVGLVLALPAFTFAGFIYRWLMLSQRSATLGMLLTGIEVRDQNGERLSAPLAFLHTLGFAVTLYFFPLMVIGWIIMIASPHRRLIHDLILSTVVINKPV